MRPLFVSVLGWLLATGLLAGEEHRVPRVRSEPLPHHQVSFLAGETEKTRWHFGADAPRPFFYPCNGPSGSSLTRMGHPGDAGHDHHRSIWFAHHDVGGLTFWADGKGTSIRQKAWLCYQDGDEESAMAVQLGWLGPDGREVLQQDLISVMRPMAQGEFTLELQSLFRPGGDLPEIKLGKTNFGFLAVRVAKTISETFGGGLLTNSEGQTHEPAIFGQPAAWVDYSGPVAPSGKTEGITYFDHPSNPRFPSKWHVREDGWMGASFCMDEGFTITRDQPLRLRYLLHAHGGSLVVEKAREVQSGFANHPALEMVEHQGKHGRWDIRRATASPAP
jgi:hypothetical protein